MPELKCEGACGVHSGPIRLVHVRDDRVPQMHDWGSFHYCQRAIEIDQENGLTVTDEDGDFILPKNAVKIAEKVLATSIWITCDKCGCEYLDDHEYNGWICPRCRRSEE